jgi:hydroxymethylglutaryl-CoA synthase
LRAAVGIDALSFAVPHRYIELSDLARARGVDPDKYTKGLGGIRMAVADPGEDTVALAATAVRRLLGTYDIDPSRIGLLAVGTETGVDHSKPVASHVQGVLELPRHMRVYDVQHACYGGTAALMQAVEWIASGANRGKAAIVVCADVARYGLHTAGEPTQGAGAVAMLVSENPRLLALDVGVNGVSSAPVWDFWRPLGSREAVVDGHYSMKCYLTALSEAYGAWTKHAREASLIPQEGPASAAFARMAYHVPFCKMAKKAHLHLRKHEQGSVPAEDEESYQRQVASSLSLCADIGNVYTGSLYLALLGLLRTDAAALSGQRLGLFSYGSGRCAEFFSGVVQPTAASMIERLRIDEVLAARQQIDIAAYEEIMKLAATEPLPEEPLAGAFRFAGLQEKRREYVRGS